jgi:predicted Zn-dependent protease
MPTPLASTVMVQEQLALALNRLGHGERAERTLQKLLSERGASSETYGILGRVYKDRWQESVKNNDLISAEGLLDEAIDAYLKGLGLIGVMLILESTLLV